MADATRSTDAAETGRARRRLRRALGRAVPLAAITLSVIAAGVAVRLADSPVLARIRTIAFDEFQVLHPRAFDPDLPVRIVVIDNASLDRIGQWPWPRTRLADLTARLTDMGAAVVAFDLILSEPDRLSPDSIAGLVPDASVRRDVRAALAGLPDGDAQLAGALAAMPTVLGVVLGVDAAGDGRTAPAAFAPKAGFAYAGDDPRDFLPPFGSLVVPLPALAGAAAGLGALNWIPARDQVVRTVPLIFRLPDGRFVPSLAAEALRVAQGAGTYVVRASNASGQSAFGAATGINAIRIGAFEVPTTPAGELVLHFSPEDPRRQIPAWQVLNGTVPPEAVEGRIVLVGATAPGLFDLQATPLDVAVAGVDINAQVIEHLVTGTALARPDWAPGLEIVLFAGLVAMLGVVAALLPPMGTVAVGLAALGVVAAATYAAFVRHGLFIDPTFPVLGSAVALFSATGWVAARERHDRRWVRQAFGRYVSDDLVAALVRDPDRLALGGEMRTLTILFCDVRGFTARAEGMDAQALTRYVNAFLTAMTDVIVANGGTIDKYMGDAIMAFWNAPLDDPAHAVRACKTALQMQAALAAFNAAHAGTYPETAIGMGINTGLCCVGNLGSRSRFDYSAIGDAVNVAARLETSTKDYGVPVLVGAATAEAAAAAGYEFLPVGAVRVKGRADAVPALALLGGPGRPVDPAMRAAMPALARLAAARQGQDARALAAALAEARAIAPPAAAGLLADHPGA